MTGSTTPTITAQVSAATIKSIGDMIDTQGGMISRAQAVKHLSCLLTYEIDAILTGADRVPLGEDASRYVIPNYRAETVLWLVSEVDRVGAALAEMVDELSQRYVEIADAGFDARKAARS